MSHFNAVCVGESAYRANFLISKRKEGAFGGAFSAFSAGLRPQLDLHMPGICQGSVKFCYLVKPSPHSDGKSAVQYQSRSLVCPPTGRAAATDPLHLAIAGHLAAPQPVGARHAPEQLNLRLPRMLAISPPDSRGSHDRADAVCGNCTAPKPEALAAALELGPRCLL